MSTNKSGRRGDALQTTAVTDGPTDKVMEEVGFAILVPTNKAPLPNGWTERTILT